MFHLWTHAAGKLISDAPDSASSAATESKDFLAFKEHVGPTLRGLVSSCSASLGQMQDLLRSGLDPNQLVAMSFNSSILQDARAELEGRLKDFSTSHAVVLKRLYKDRSYESKDSFDLLGGVQRPAVDATQAGDFVFTVYFFIFNVEAFVGELTGLQSTFDSMHACDIRLMRGRQALQTSYGRPLGSLLYSAGIGMPSSQLDDETPNTHRWAIFKERLFSLSPRSRPSSLFPQVGHAVAFSDSLLIADSNSRSTSICPKLRG